jgi:hypothetical protein
MPSLDEIGRIGQPGLARAVIENFQTAGTRDEIDVVAAQFRVGRAVPIIKRKAGRRGFDGLFHDVGGKQDSITTGIGLQSMVQQALAHFPAANLHAGFGHDTLGLVQNSDDQVFTENIERGSHRIVVSFGTVRHEIEVAKSYQHRTHRYDNRFSSHRAAFCAPGFLRHRAATREGGQPLEWLPHGGGFP